MNKTPFTLFSFFASKSTFTTLSLQELEVALGDIEYDLGAKHLQSFFNDFKSYRTEKFNFMNVCKDTMELDMFYRLFTLKSMAFEKKTLV